jgi:3-oxoacyl-(acyl-carrier-protein) synthase
MADVAITGLAAMSALGRGPAAQLSGVLAGSATFTPVDRFDTTARRVRLAATLPDAGTLTDELASAIGQACQDGGLRGPADVPVLLAVHGHPAAARSGRTEDGRPRHTAAHLAAELTERLGLAGVPRIYTSACVSAGNAVADAAAMITTGRLDRVVVAAGYLVESDQFALFDAGRGLATDGAIRPFSTGRTGLLLGDAVAAVVLESVEAARARGVTDAARLLGWARTGDGFHPVQPHPNGDGMARAIRQALGRAGLDASAVGHVNAHGTGSPMSDAAEAAALAEVFGVSAGVPVSATKSVHGHALEASVLLELVITVLALRAGKLPPTAGFLGADPACPVNVITDAPATSTSDVAVSVNAAFGGANTAIVVRAA